MNDRELWDRYRRHLCVVDSLGLELDPSRMRFGDDFFDRMAQPMAQAFDEMEALERGAIANPDENRMVGHYWLRAPELAPTPEHHSGDPRTRWRRSTASPRTSTPGASARRRPTASAGSSWSASAARRSVRSSWPMRSAGAQDAMRPSFLDNTDPDGIDRVLGGLGDELAATLTVVI